jgi:hypothetical protein
MPTIAGFFDLRCDGSAAIDIERGEGWPPASVSHPRRRVLSTNGRRRSTVFAPIPGTLIEVIDALESAEFFAHLQDRIRLRRPRFRGSDSI